MKERKKYVWLVIAGEDYEGGTVSSVHKSKRMAVKQLQKLYDEGDFWHWDTDNKLPILRAYGSYITIEKHELK